MKISFRSVDMFFIIGVFLLVYVTYRIIRYYTKNANLKKIRKNWGVIFHNPFGIDIAKLFWNNKQKEEKSGSDSLDDETWRDLNMDDLFRLMNRTITPIGAQYLYNVLRHPLTDKNEIKKRNEYIRLLKSDRSLREKLQLIIFNLSHPYSAYLSDSLWGELPERPAYSLLYYFFHFTAIAVLTMSLLGMIHYISVIVIFAINNLLRSFWLRKNKTLPASFRFLPALIGSCSLLAQIKDDRISDILNSVRDNLSEAEKMKKKLISFYYSDETGIYVIFKTYFMLDVIGYFSIAEQFKTNLLKLRKLFELFGYLDSLISAAAFVQSSPLICDPVFVAQGGNFCVKQIAHPLLVEPVANDFVFENKNVIITGSNMAGKSTFLKTIGINAVLAQTFGICCAEEYSAPIVKIISSIEREEDLSSGRSYYMAEVESIRRIIEESTKDSIHLFIIDEIFRGTNSVERSAASSEVLKFIANGKDFTLIATHDLQLTGELVSIYNTYHFREDMKEDGLHFDYKIYPGITKSRNAIALLDFVGYPKIIVENAKKRILNNL